MSSDQFPKPWRLGRRLSRRGGPHYGFVTVYDATVDGDGDDEGRVIGFMQVEAAGEMLGLLEQLKQLRVAARYVAEDACVSDHVPYPGEMVIHGRGIELLKAALEGKNDV